MDRSEILRRFEQWLDTAMAEEDPPKGIPAEILAGDSGPESSPTDWYAMWASVTALRNHPMRSLGLSYLIEELRSPR